MQTDHNTDASGSVLDEEGDAPERVTNPDVSNAISRRELLKRAGRGLAVGVFSPAIGDAFAKELQANHKDTGKGVSFRTENSSGKTPISLIVDDGSPVDPLFYEIPGYETPFLVPLEFVESVATTFEKFDLRGKFTLIPMPSCLGRIDQSLKRVPADHLKGFLKLVRERIAPRFDITPEFLTHLNAYDLKSGKYQHIYEDVWITRAPQAEIADYFILAFTILRNVGLNATGITSPWSSGTDVETKYAQALMEAQRKTFERKVTWYFLHTADWGEPQRCFIEYEDSQSGQAVVSVPANFPDIFWSMDLPTRTERAKFINDGIERLVSADGRTGRIRQLIESGHPVTLITHWQSLYTQGNGLGLEGLKALMERIQKVFGSHLEWVSCSERAQRYVASAHARGAIANPVG